MCGTRLRRGIQICAHCHLCILCAHFLTSTTRARFFKSVHVFNFEKVTVSAIPIVGDSCIFSDGYNKKDIVRCIAYSTCSTNHHHVLVDTGGSNLC